jgi:alpha-L-rhamnosidase
MYENILGIQPDYNSPGFRHFILKPLPGGTLNWAKGSFDSFSGKIEAGWTKDGNKFEYSFTIPPNTSATVFIPAKSIEKAAIIVDQAEEEFSNTGYADGYAVFEIKSGTYKAISEI